VRTQPLHLPPAARRGLLLSGAKAEQEDRHDGEQKAISHLLKIKHPIR
jgi:hypothetical protein